MPIKTLSSLKCGRTAIISKYNNLEKLHYRVLEMGLIPGEKVRMIKKNPFYGPVEIKIKSYYLSIRLQDAKLILIN